MRYKLLLLIFLVLFLPMNLYSRALRHVNMDDVRQKHQQKLIEQKIQEEKKKEEEKYIASVMKEKKYDWRKELNEGMTSSGTFFTTLPATGDVDLQVSNLDSNEYIVSDDISFESGTNAGFTGGFSSDGGVINLGGENEYSSFAASSSYDLSVVDTLNITSIAGNNSNGGMLPTAPLELYFYNVDTDEISDPIQVASPSSTSLTNLNITIPEKFRSSNVELLLGTDTSDGFGLHGRHFAGQTIPLNGLNHGTIGSFGNSGLLANAYTNLLSSYLRSGDRSDSNMRNLGEFFWFNVNANRFGWFDNVGTPEDPELIYRTWPAAPVSGATTENGVTDADRIYIGRFIYDRFKGTKLYGITNISFRRRTPISVFVPLDSPEASSFIRTDPMMSNLSPQERLKKLKEMLEASDEYVMKMLGSNFPGTGAVPPGELGDTPGVDIQDFQIASEPLRGQKTDVKYDPNMKMFVPRPSEKDAGEIIQTLVKNA